MKNEVKQAYQKALTETAEFLGVEVTEIEFEQCLGGSVSGSCKINGREVEYIPKVMRAETAQYWVVTLLMKYLPR